MLEQDEVRHDLAAAYRLADRFGLNEGISNHFTARHPGAENQFFVAPHGLHWSQVRPERLLTVDASGAVLDGAGVVEPSALFIHSRMLDARRDAACVLHTHQTYTTAITVLQSGRLLPISQNALRFHDRIAYDDRYDGAADHAAEGERLAAAIGMRDVLFHANHGVIVVAESIARGFDDLYFLERASQVQILAQSTGERLRYVPDAVAERYVDLSRANNLRIQATAHFTALKSTLAAQDEASAL